MASYNVIICGDIPEAGIQLLEAQPYALVFSETLASVDPAQLAKAHALLTLLSDTVDRHLIDSAPALKVIANYAVGFNNIDVAYAASRGIKVTNTPDILTPATADLTWALILAAARRIVEGDRFVREGLFKGWGAKLLLGRDLNGKTLGIIGAGRIGQAVGQRAIGFGMKILYYAPSAKAEFERTAGARRAGLEEVLAKADFLSLHCPLTEQTHHLLNAQNMPLIKQGAYLINTARGAVIDEKVLVQMLQNGHLAGAGLDVYEFEPQITPELLEMDNVVLLPHIGSATVETRDEMARMAARNIISVLETGQALNGVN